MDSFLERFVRRRAKDRCEYCRMSRNVSPFPYEIDHIISRKHHGTTTAENLCARLLFLQQFQRAEYCRDRSSVRANRPIVPPSQGSLEPPFRLGRRITDRSVPNRSSDHCRFGDEPSRYFGVSTASDRRRRVSRGVLAIVRGDSPGLGTMTSVAGLRLIEKCLVLCACT